MVKATRIAVEPISHSHAAVVPLPVDRPRAAPYSGPPMNPWANANWGGRDNATAPIAPSNNVVPLPRPIAAERPGPSARRNLFGPVEAVERTTVTAAPSTSAMAATDLKQKSRWYHWRPLSAKRSQRSINTTYAVANPLPSADATATTEDTRPPAKKERPSSARRFLSKLTRPFSARPSSRVTAAPDAVSAPVPVATLPVRPMSAVTVRPETEAQLQAKEQRTRVVSARMHARPLGQTEDVVDVMARQAGLSHPEIQEVDEDGLEVEHLAPEPMTAWGAPEPVCVPY